MRACAEFPNDNPGLHHGAIWRCATTSGPATFELPERDEHPRADTNEATIAIGNPVSPDPPTVDEGPLPFVEKGADGSAGADDPFKTLLGVLEDVARVSGASEDVVAAMRSLLGEDRLGTVPEASVEALVAGKQLERTARSLKRTEAFTRTVLAWQGILRAESEDFAGCGSTALDDWAADIVARLLGNPAHAAGLRRELRRRGVAAFGLVAEAA